MKKLNHVLLALCALLMVGCNQTSFEYLSVKQMYEDIDFYITKIKENNPQPYVRYSESVIDSLHQNLKSVCNETMSRTDFLFQLQKTAKYFDMHSRILTNLSEKDILVSTDSLFPKVEIEGGKMFYNNAELLKIGDVSTEAILADLDNMVSWEFTQEKRVSEMNRNLSPILHYIHHIKAPYRCQVRDTASNEISTIDIEPITEEELIQALNPWFVHKHMVGANEFDIFPKDYIAIFYFNSADIYDERIKEILNKGIVARFEEMAAKGIKHLFIDVSRNGGGSDNIHEFFTKHLNSQAYNDSLLFKVSKSMHRQDSINTINHLKKNGLNIDFANAYKDSNLSEKDLKILENTDFTAKNMSVSWMVASKGIDLGYSDLVREYAANKGDFDGKVYVIQSKNTASAGYNFCELVKKTKIGHLVGGIPGQRSPFCGNSKREKLPNSQFLLQYPTTIFIQKHPITDGEGFLHPDIPYPLDKPLTIEDYKNIIRLTEEL